MKSFLTWLKAQAARRSFLSNTLMLAGGTLAGQALLAGVLPVLTRLYHPSEIGLFGMYLSFIAPATMVVTLKLDSAIVSADNLSDAAYLLLAGVTFSIPMSLMFSLILYLLKDNALLGFEALPHILCRAGFSDSDSDCGISASQALVRPQRIFQDHLARAAVPQCRQIACPRLFWDG